MASASIFSGAFILFLKITSIFIFILSHISSVRKERLELPKSIIADSPTRRQRVFAFFKQKKEWVKLNTSFLAGATTSVVTMHVASQIAEKQGISRGIAATVVAGLAGYITGTLVTCASWLSLNTKQYEGQPVRVFSDMIEMVKNSFISQTITWGFAWFAAGVAVYNDASNFLATLVQQLAGVVYIPIFNYLNRNIVNTMAATEEKVKI